MRNGVSIFYCEPKNFLKWLFIFFILFHAVNCLYIYSFAHILYFMLNFPCEMKKKMYILVLVIFVCETFFGSFATGVNIFKISYIQSLLKVCFRPHLISLPTYNYVHVIIFKFYVTGLKGKKRKWFVWEY